MLQGSRPFWQLTELGFGARHLLRWRWSLGFGIAPPSSAQPQFAIGQTKFLSSLQHDLKHDLKLLKLSDLDLHFLKRKLRGVRKQNCFTITSNKKVRVAADLQPNMGTLLFTELGEHCAKTDCAQLDFLPFKCDACQEVSVHSSALASVTCICTSFLVTKQTSIACL
jgi:hypothetical protein